jgi:uncharacterized repeat protein (TIGR01451 family)
MSGLTPTSGPETGGTIVVITGTELTGGTVTFGGTAATCTVDSSTQITCTTPAHVVGPVNVVVTTPGGTATSAGGFSYYGADLVMTMTQSSSTVAAGGALNYTLTVVNNGPMDAANVTLTDVLPADVRFITMRGPAGWTLSTSAVGTNGTVSATRAALAASAGPQVFTVVVAVPTYAGAVTNTATISATTGDHSPGDNSASATATVLPSVPTMGQWGLMLLALLLAAGGVYALGRRQRDATR